MSGEDIVSGFMGFSVSQWRGEPNDALIPSLHRWMLENPTSWHTPRFDTQEDHGAQTVIVFRGESGTGKSTQMEFEAKALADASDRNVVIRIDFSQASLITCPLDVFHSRLWQFIDGQVTPTIERSGLEVQYRAAMYRVVLNNFSGKHFYGIRDKYGFNKPHDFTKLSELQLAGANDIMDAIRQYQDDTDDGSLILSAVQHLSGDYRAVIFVDNVDHLGMAKVELVMQILTTSIERNTRAFLAVRPEHSHLLKTFDNTRPALVRNLDIIEDHVFDIAKVRCKGAVEYARLNEPAKLAGVEAYTRRMDDLVYQIEGDPHSITLLNSWHNGDLRQMLNFISEASWSAFNRDNVASVRSVIYRNLVRNSLPVDLIDIFSPKPYPSQLYRRYSFLFPKLRVLAYLAHRGDTHRTVRLSQMLDDFREQLGVSESAIGDAVVELATEPGTSGALLRIVDEGDEPVVVFLPAGSVFMSHVVYSCDFLSWVYDRSTNDGLPTILADPLNYRQVKLDKAALVLIHIILKRFEEEHPYMNRYKAPRVMDGRRLAAYESLFGYGPGNWFIQTMFNEISDYARIRQLDRTVLDVAQARVRDAAIRLDAAYDVKA